MAKKDIIDSSLSMMEFDIIKKCKLDPLFFSSFAMVIHPIKGKVPFKLYPYQRAVLLAFLNHRFNIVLKFRQGGITELIGLYCLWLAMFYVNKNIIIISIKDRVAKKVLRRIKYIYKNLPGYLQVPIVNGKGADLGTASEIEFSNGSTITSIPTTEDAGRSEAASLVVIDEAAIVKWAGKIWAAIFPTLSTGGSGILNSTPYGVGNFYHQTWVDACSGGNPFNAIRLKYPMHPDYTQEWYQSQKSILGPRRTAQEIDGDFLTSGSTVFDLYDIRAIEDELEDYPPLNIRDYSIFNKVKDYSGALRVYEIPQKNVKYFLAADISTGRSRDYTTITILDFEGDEKLSFRAKIPINETTKLIGQLGLIYNRALAAPESNDIGLGVAVGLQQDGYPNLYYTKRLLKEKGESKPKVESIPGWYTTRKNRPVIIAGLEEDIRLDSMTIKDPFFVQESYTFIYDDQNRPVALGKTSGNESDGDEEGTYTDDTIFSKAICNQIRKGSYKGPIILPK